MSTVSLEDSKFGAVQPGSELELAVLVPLIWIRGKVLMTPNLGWGDLNIRDQLNHYFDCPVVVMNDIDAGIMPNIDLVQQRMRVLLW